MAFFNTKDVGIAPSLFAQCDFRLSFLVTARLGASQRLALGEQTIARFLEGLHVILGHHHPSISRCESLIARLRVIIAWVWSCDFQNLCLNPSETPVLLGSPSLQLRMIFAEIELCPSSLYVKPVAICGVL